MPVPLPAAHAGAAPAATATAAAAAARVVVATAVVAADPATDAGWPCHGSGAAGARERTYDSEAESSSVDASGCVLRPALTAILSAPPCAKNWRLAVTQFAVCVCACASKQMSVFSMRRNDRMPAHYDQPARGLAPILREAKDRSPIFAYLSR